MRVGYRVLLEGQPLDDEATSSLTSVEVEDQSRLTSMARLTFAADANGADPVWALLEGGRMGRLAQVDVEAQIGRTFESIFHGHVVDVQVAFPRETGLCSVEVTCMDPSVRLQLEDKARPWPDRTDGDIAAAIFRAAQMDPVVNETEAAQPATERVTTQHGTDLQFLRQLATRNGFECYVEKDPSSGTIKGHFHAPAFDARPQGVLQMARGEASSLLSLRIRHDLLRPAAATARSIRIATLEVQEGAQDRTSRPALGEESTLIGGAARTMLLSRSGLVDQAELRRWAQATVDVSAVSLTAEGELEPAVYRAVLRAHRTVALRGVGERFSGTYYVETVTHLFEQTGYRVWFTLSRNALRAREVSP
ncbi:MAG: contractile injection system protein, VgrG/Pvc8 family [bacterium]